MTYYFTQEERTPVVFLTSLFKHIYVLFIYLFIFLYSEFDK
jgi:hypothetical protein